MTCSGAYNSSTNLWRSDVSFHNEKRGDNEVFLQLRIKASKTDPFRASATKTIGSNSGIYCPVRALQTYRFTCVNGLCATIVLLFVNQALITHDTLRPAVQPSLFLSDILTILARFS